MNPIKTWLFSKGEKQYVARVYEDPGASPPWDDDGHGRVVSARIRHENSDDWRRLPDGWAYAWSDAVQTAKTDGWGLMPNELGNLQRKLGRIPTPEDVAIACVKADFDDMEAYLNGDWFFVGVSVVEVPNSGEIPAEEYGTSLWRVDYQPSHADPAVRDYWKDVARDLAPD